MRVPRSAAQLHFHQGLPAHLCVLHTHVSLPHGLQAVADRLLRLLLLRLSCRRAAALVQRAQALCLLWSESSGWQENQLIEAGRGGGSWLGRQWSWQDAALAKLAGPTQQRHLLLIFLTCCSRTPIELALPKKTKPFRLTAVMRPPSMSRAACMGGSRGAWAAVE